MGKTSRNLFSSIYENDIVDLKSLEEKALDKIRLEKSTKRVKKSVTTAKSKTTAMSTNPVEATCNKCSHKIIGDLVSDIYLLNIDKVIPLITYTCHNCGHNGRRSVLSLALPQDQYERKYFN